MDEIEAEIVYREAQTCFLKATQAMISEKIDMDFCMDIFEKIQDGWEKAEALETAIEEYGYHIKEDVA